MRGSPAGSRGKVWRLGGSHEGGRAAGLEVAESEGMVVSDIEKEAEGVRREGGAAMGLQVESMGVAKRGDCCGWLLRRLAREVYGARLRGEQWRTRLGRERRMAEGVDDGGLRRYGFTKLEEKWVFRS